MNIESLRTYCLSKPGVTESFPFGDDTLVFKVGDKIFALASLDGNPLSVNLKCDPPLATDLREQFPAVRPGFHMNKKHWNTILIDGTIREIDLLTWIDHSYELVFQGLPKSVRLKIERMA